RACGAWKGELELDGVVDRIERAHRQEIEIPSLGVECRTVVTELGLGEEHARRVLYVVQLDRAVPRARPERISEPGAVGRPSEILAAACVAPVDHLDFAARDVADQHLVAMVGDRDALAARRRTHRDDAPDVPGKDARSTVLPYLDALFAGRVADRDERRP